VYAPGCPPTPETLLHAITTLHGIMQNREILNRRNSTTGLNVRIDEIPSSGRPVAVSLGRK
jgi:NADH-quinone oxidoreductase subunit B